MKVFLKAIQVPTTFHSIVALQECFFKLLGEVAEDLLDLVSVFFM